MAFVKEVGNGYFFIDIADDEGISVTDEMLQEAKEAFGSEPEISQGELDMLLDIPGDQPLKEAGSDDGKGATAGARSEGGIAPCNIEEIFSTSREAPKSTQRSKRKL